MSTRGLDNASFAARFRERKKARALLAVGYIDCKECGGARRYITEMHQAKTALAQAYTCNVCEKEAERQRLAKQRIEDKIRREKSMDCKRREGTLAQKANERIASEKLSLTPKGTRVDVQDWGAVAIWNMVEMKTMITSKHSKMSPNGLFSDAGRRSGVSFVASDDAIDWFDKQMEQSVTGKVRKDVHRLYWIDGEPRPRPFAGISGVAAGQADMIGMRWHKRGKVDQCAMYHPKVHQANVEAFGPADFIAHFASMPETYVEFLGGKFEIESVHLTSASGGPMKGYPWIELRNPDNCRDLFDRRMNLSERKVGGPLVADGRVTGGLMTGKRFRFALF